MKRFHVFALIVSLGLVNSTHAHQQTNVDELNLIEIADLDYIQTHPLLHTIKSRTATSVELYTPPIGNQQTLNSCVGWALCYAGVSIRLYNDYGNWTDALCSPSFLFNQYKGTIASVDSANCDSVSSNIRNLGVKLMQNGTCTLAQMPYTTNCNLQPTAAQKIDALNKKYTVNQIPQSSLNDISFYKAALENGWPIVVGMHMYNVFDTIWNDPSAYGLWDRVDTTDYDHEAAGHASCIVGYDDAKEAFKVMNSWGTSGGDAGYYWVKYNVVQKGVYSDALFVIQRDSAQIEGPSVLTDSAWYYLRNVPAGATITWSLHNYSTVPKHCVIAQGQGTDSVYIALRPTTYIPPIFPWTPDGTGLVAPYAKLTVTISAGTQTYTASKNLHRPPTPSLINNMPHNNSYTFELWHSAYGLLRTQNIQSADEQIDTSGLPQGLYIIITKENGQPIKQTKIMIQ